MTDKEDYDYCAHCDVEPPALKFKCPECEHNPDNENFAKGINVPHKEQIIIDGVNVSECIFLDIVNERLWCDNVNISAIGKSQCPYVDCFKNPNCYYKQLARKTQEYSELLEQHKELDDRVNRMIEEKYNLARECEALKKECEELKAYAQRQENQRETYYKELLKKDKALEEIEEYVRDNSDFDKSNILTSKTGAYDILNIIDKAKGE